MATSVLVPVSLPSFACHQEARFLLPVITPLIVVVASYLHYTRSIHSAYVLPFSSCTSLVSKKTLTTWLVFMCDVFGFLHGVFKTLSYLSRLLQQQHFLVPLPTHCLLEYCYTASPHMVSSDKSKHSPVVVHNIGCVDYFTAKEIFGSTRNGETNVVNLWLLRPDIDHSTVGKDSVLRKQFFPHVGTKNLYVTLRQLSMFDGDTFKFII